MEATVTHRDRDFPIGSDTPARFLSIDTHVLVGSRKTIAVNQPAAGAEWSVTVPGGRLWRLIGGQATLALSAAVANRNAGAKVTAGGAIIFDNGNLANLAAGTSWTVVYQQGTALNPSGNFHSFVQVPLVPSWLEQGDTIGSDTVLIQAGDQYSAISLLVEELLFNNQDLTERAAMLRGAPGEYSGAGRAFHG